MRLIPSNSSGSTSTFSKPTRKCSNATVREIPAFFADLPRNVRVDVLPEPSVSNKQQALQCVHGVLRWGLREKGPYSAGGDSAGGGFLADFRQWEVGGSDADYEFLFEEA